MTPAEKLAAAKPRKRPRRNVSEKWENVPLKCTLRIIREKLNLSLRDVADAVGLSVSGMHAIEHGRDVQMTTALRLAEFYGVDVNEIWKLK